MEHKKILKSIESISSGNFSSENEILSYILGQLVQNEQINVDGGRIWKLNKKIKAYEILFQKGRVSKLNKKIVLKVSDYEVLKKITSERSVLAYETNEILKKKGILRYSASGVGDKIKIGSQKYYEYLLALNSNNIDEILRYTINIVASILTSKIKDFRFKSSAEIVNKDIDKAKELQRSILPEHELVFNKYHIYGVTVPAQTLGGDFFDYLPISDDNTTLGIAVGDAASKGISAAAEAMYISGAMRMASAFEIKISSMMRRLNQLVNKIFSDDRFASLFYCELFKDRKGMCHYANAGHNPPIIYRAASGRTEFLNTTGPLLGPAPNSVFNTESVYFQNNDILVIYSDGVTESANDKFVFYEEKRLKRAIRKNSALSPKEIALAILDDVINFSTAESKYQDDKTIVVIKRIDE